jgi:hypothetical protein
MKLLFVVVISIMGFSVFAEEKTQPPNAPSGFGVAPFGDSPMGIDLTPVVPPQLPEPPASPTDLRIPGGSGPESGQAPKDRVTDGDEKQDQAQSSQQNPVNVPVLKTEPNTKSPQTANHQADGDINPHKKAEGLGKTFWFIFWIVVAVAAPIIAFLTYRQNRKAHALTEQHRERTEKFAYLRERPLLSFVEWELTPHDSKKRRTVDDDLDTVRCNLVNVHGTPAILGGIYENRWVVDTLPAAPNFRQKLSGRLKGTMLAKDGKSPVKMDPLPTVDRKAVDRGQKMLYAFVFVEYSDTFGGQYEACSLMKYQDKIFVVEEHPGYTCKS